MENADGQTVDWSQLTTKAASAARVRTEADLRCQPGVVLTPTEAVACVTYQPLTPGDGQRLAASTELLADLIDQLRRREYARVVVVFDGPLTTYHLTLHVPSVAADPIHQLAVASRRRTLLLDGLSRAGLDARMTTEREIATLVQRFPQPDLQHGHLVDQHKRAITALSLTAGADFTWPGLSRTLLRELAERQAASQATTLVYDFGLAGDGLLRYSTSIVLQDECQRTGHQSAREIEASLFDQTGAVVRADGPQQALKRLHGIAPFRVRSRPGRHPCFSMGVADMFPL